MQDRIPQLCSGDEDGTGSIDFEEFLQVFIISHINSKCKAFSCNPCTVLYMKNVSLLYEYMNCRCIRKIYISKVVLHKKNFIESNNSKSKLHFNCLSLSQILYDQQEVEHSTTPLSKTFVNVNNDVKFIRWMSTVQQIRAGFL